MTDYMAYGDYVKEIEASILHESTIERNGKKYRPDFKVPIIWVEIEEEDGTCHMERLSHLELAKDMGVELDV